VAQAYFDAGAQVGEAMAKNGWALVYGGNSVGLMKTVADAVRLHGGRVVGITPQLMVDKGIHDALADELVVTNDMRDRKALMEQRGDAFLTLPGGLGTLEEIFEIIVGKQLGYHDKAIVLLNINGYFTPMLEMIEHGIEQKFIKARARGLYFVAGTVEEAMEHFKVYRPAPMADKWTEDVPSAAE